MINCCEILARNLLCILMGKRAKKFAIRKQPSKDYHIQNKKNHDLSKRVKHQGLL